MPWSDWQTGDTGTANWVDLGRGYRVRGGSESGDWRMYARSDPSAPYAARIVATALESTTEDGPYGLVKEEAYGAFLTLPDSWKQVRRGIPNGLRSLEVGKDYDQIPGRPGEYVEYEPGDNVPVSTVAPSISFISGDRGGGFGSLRDGDGAWTLGSVVGAVAPAPTAIGEVIPNGQWPGLGTAFVSGGPDVAVGTNYRPYVPDLTGAKDVFLSPRMTGTPPLAGAFESVQFNIGVPQLTYQMPRYRYWIPTKPPLRLRQRDDNLFLNAGRLRNRASRQTTNRLRSYD